MKKQFRNFKVSNEVLPQSPNFLQKLRNPQRLFAFTSPSGSIFQLTLPESKLEESEKSALVSSAFAFVTVAEPLSMELSNELLQFLHQNVN